MSKLSRKNFLKVSALGAAGTAFTVNPLLAATNRAVSAKEKKAAPSDTINMALIGCGAQGPGVATGFMGIKGVQMIGGCDVYSIQRDKFANTVNSYYEARDIKNKGFQVYEFHEQLLENPDLDAVIIATPDHWHCLIAVAACQAGKDVYVEKPMAFTVYEGQQLVKAVRKYGRMMQTGSMQRSMATFEQMAKIVQSGVLGKIKTIYAPVGDAPHPIDYEEQPVPAGLNWDRWLGPLDTKYYYNEELCPTNGGWGGWRWHKGLGGGYTTDWGAHMFDCAQWAIGKDRNGPITVIPPEESPYKSLTYVYDNGIEMIQHYDPWDGNRGNSVKIIGENGWVFASRSDYYCSNPAWSRPGQDDTNMPEASQGGQRQDPFAGMSDEEREAAMAEMRARMEAQRAERANQNGGQGFVAGVGRDGNEINSKHYLSFTDAIKTRVDPNTPVEVGQSSSVLCNIGNIAYDLKRTLHWSPLTDTFLNDSEANNHYIMNYKMRAPWSIDNI